MTNNKARPLNLADFDAPPLSEVVLGVQFERPALGAWYTTSVQRLNDLCALPKGWDGYFAGPVSFEHATFAIDVLKRTCKRNMPAPNIVPAPDGDLQLEWHTMDADIEIHIISRFQATARLHRPVDPQADRSISLRSDFTEVGAWLSEVLE